MRYFIEAVARELISPWVAGQMPYDELIQVLDEGMGFWGNVFMNQL